jgi:UDP-N-acetyl-2-amino-2-deoxyglucuronate dehydrogenase
MKKKLNKINVGIIGIGRISLHHIKCIISEKKFSLSAISDLNISKLRKFSKKYKIPGYLDYKEMLIKHKEINLVIIATPSGMHYEHARDVIIKFKKNLIIEKPLTLKINQAKELFNLSKKKNIKIFPVFQNRYNSAVRRVKKSIISGEIGKIRVINIRVRWCRQQKYYNMSAWRGTYSHDGGALTNQGIHHVDLLRYLFGEVSYVNCQMRTLGSKIEVEDTIVATFGYKNGAVGTLEITTAARPNDYEASVSMLGSKGMAQIGGIAVNKLEIFTPKPNDISKFSESFKNDYYGFGHKRLYKSISDYFFKKKNFLISYDDCLKTLKLLHCFYSSAEENKKVFFKNVKDSKKLGKRNEKISKLYRYNAK